MALRGVDTEYLDNEESEGVQFAPLLDDELLLEKGEEVASDPSSESRTGQRAAGGFITILE